MATNIIEAVQQKLGYASLHKIDPNTQEVKESISQSDNEKLVQAAIPTVLAGLFNYTRTDKGCNYILSGGGPEDWIDSVFDDKKQEVVEKVAHYAKCSEKEAEKTMEDIADEAVVVIHAASAGEKGTAEKVKAYMSDQRHHILVYLVPSLQMGYLLNDNAIDDRTNKMEGPISNMVHSIENKFSGGGS